MLATEKYTQNTPIGNKNFQSICAPLLPIVAVMRGNIALIHSLLLLINLFAGVALGLNAVPPPPDQGECLVYFSHGSGRTGLMV